MHHRRKRSTDTVVQHAGLAAFSTFLSTSQPRPADQPRGKKTVCGSLFFPQSQRSRCGGVLEGVEGGPSAQPNSIPLLLSTSPAIGAADLRLGYVRVCVLAFLAVAMERCARLLYCVATHHQASLSARRKETSVCVCYLRSYKFFTDRRR
jgi:hypothetical protein